MSFFALLVYMDFVLPIKPSLSQLTSFLTFTFLILSPLVGDEQVVAWDWWLPGMKPQHSVTSISPVSSEVSLSYASSVFPAEYCTKIFMQVYIQRFSWSTCSTSTYSSVF